jgi:uncharacterized protein
MRPTITDIGVYGGGFFDAFDPRPEDITIEAIAHALSLTCRWGGHCKDFYSVAQHSVEVAAMLPPDLALQGLLHDAAEAYIGDVPRPIKHKMRMFVECEEKILRVIWDKFGLKDHEIMHPSVHEADEIMLNFEASNLLDEYKWANNPFPGLRLIPWSSGAAESAFLETYRKLTNESTDRRRHTSV